MNMPRPAASIKYSGQGCRKASNKLAPSRESGIKRHPAINEDACAVDIVRLVGGQESGHSPDVLRLSNAAVRDQVHQGVVCLRCFPGGRVNRRPNGAWADAIHADAMRRGLLRNASHQQHHTTFRGGVIRVARPWNDLVDGAHTDDLAGRYGHLFDNSPPLELTNRFASAQKLPGEINAYDLVPLSQSHLIDR